MIFFFVTVINVEIKAKENLLNDKAIYVTYIFNNVYMSDLYFPFIITFLNLECVLCLCVCWLGHLDVWGELAGHIRSLTHRPSSQGWAFRCPVID